LTSRQRIRHKTRLGPTQKENRILFLRGPLTQLPGKNPTGLYGTHTS
jgi:hypothetical protein